MSSNTAHDCKEHHHGEDRTNLTRRQFLGTGAVAALAAGLPAWFPRVALANNSGCSPCTLIQLFGRGGWDGLSLCPPYGDPSYYQTRPLSGSLAFSPPGSTDNRDVLDLDGVFGMPRAMQALMGPWQDSNLAIVQAVGYTQNHSYSHFTGQRQLEIGQPAPPATLNSGWVGRHLASRQLAGACADPILRSLSFGISNPRSFGGGLDGVATPDPNNFGLTGPSSTVDRRLLTLETMYQQEGNFSQDAEQILETITLLQTVDFENYTSSAPPGFDYPTSSLGKAFRAIAAMLHQGLPVEAYSVDIGGWDTHSRADPHNLFTGGTLYYKMKDLADSMAAFYLDLQAKSIQNWVISAMTEFGRTARENGNSGTDHAKGNCMFLLGEPVNGGIYGQWPGLDQLTGNDGNDLPITTDFRLVAAELVSRYMQNGANLNAIFPGYPTPSTSQFLGLFN